MSSFESLYKNALIATSRKRIPVEAFGLTVHLPYYCPTWNSTKPKNVKISVQQKLHTTQKFVSRDLVEKYVEKIRNGEAPTVVVGAARRPDDPKLGRTWMFDGHHTLAAYRVLGLPAPARMYEEGSDVGGPAGAPKYRMR